MKQIAVIYDPKEKTKQFKDVIKKIYKAAKRKTVFDYSQVERIIVNELYKRMLSFKNEHFKYEKEQRLILYVPKKIPEEFSETTKLEVQFNARNGYIIPFIEIEYKNNDLLEEITVGPLLEREMSRNTLELLKERYKYSYRVVSSTVPIRF